MTSKVYRAIDAVTFDRVPDADGSTAVSVMVLEQNNKLTNLIFTGNEFAKFAAAFENFQKLEKSRGAKPGNFVAAD